MNQSNLRKFKADFGNFKFTCSIEYTAFYMFGKVAKDLARQYAKKLFGRLGDVASLREGRHGLPPHRYWNYEGYICKFDKFGRSRSVGRAESKVAVSTSTLPRLLPLLRLKLVSSDD
jgi:hypothetical protein